jgi:hypothetical protein
MRTYGRVSFEDGTRRWVEVDTDSQGFNDLVWITTMAQCFYLSPGESPFFAQYGIPAVQSVRSQVPPDFYVSRMQSLFAPHFASLIVSRLPNRPATLKEAPVPTYQVGVVTHQGAVMPQITFPTSVPV